MKPLKRSELEPGKSVLFKILADKTGKAVNEWSIDIVGYVQSESIITMSYGDLPLHYDFFEYNQLNKTFLLIKDEPINEDDLKTYKINLKGLL